MPVIRIGERTLPFGPLYTKARELYWSLRALLSHSKTSACLSESSSWSLAETIGLPLTRHSMFSVCIVPGEGTFALRMITVGGFVEYMRSRGQDRKAVSKSRRNPKHAVVLSGEKFTAPFSKIGRAAPQVHDYVEDFSAGHSHQFSLRVANLVVQSAEYVLR